VLSEIGSQRKVLDGSFAFGMGAAAILFFLPEAE
jgi:hypothetical protein